MNSVIKKIEKNSLRKSGKLLFLSDYRLDCENCASVKLQVLQILARDVNGPFVVNAYRCPRCEWFFPLSDEDQENFDRFMEART